jgi:hypothetical protein
VTLRIIWHRILLDIWNLTKVRQAPPERPEMLRAWAKPFGPLAKAIFHPLSSVTGIIRYRSASVGRANPGTMLRAFLALLARLERAALPTRPTAALPQISQMEPITTPFPGPNGALRIMQFR